MADGYKTIYEGRSAEIEEKKSRFIAHVKGVESEEEASAFINEIKKKYWDARHNCSAFVIGEHREIMRSSDDGEPSGTAGKPILEVILGEKLTNTAIVVTRYFGGTLLGTGGLIRAYTQAAQEGLLASDIIEKKAGRRLSLRMDYTLEGKVRYYFAENNIVLEEPIYSEKVDLHIIVDELLKEGFIKDLVELSGGKIEIEEMENLFFSETGGKVIIF